MKEKYKIIQNNLEKIRKLDPDFQAFGSGRWKYNLWKITEKEINLCERKNNITLPNEFKEFITELGFGAGPSYGAIPPDVLAFDKWEREKGDNEDYKDYKPLYGGYIVIAEYGSGIETLIIVAGEHKGEIWHNTGIIKKLNDSYYDWYLEWTEKLLNILEKGENIRLFSGLI